MRKNAFNVLWGLDNTAGLNVICMTLAMNDVPNFYYFQKRLFIYFHVNDSWGMGLRSTCLCCKVSTKWHSLLCPKESRGTPKRSLAWEGKSYVLRLRKLYSYINRACVVVSIQCIQAWLPTPHLGWHIKVINRLSPFLSYYNKTHKRDLFSSSYGGLCNGRHHWFLTKFS